MVESLVIAAAALGLIGLMLRRERKLLEEEQRLVLRGDLDD